MMIAESSQMIHVMTVLFKDNNYMTFFLNAMFLQGCRQAWLTTAFFLLSMNSWGGADSRVVSFWLLYVFEFLKIFLLNWLPPKTTEPRLPCNLIHSQGRRDGFVSFSTALVQKRTRQTIADFELNSLILIRLLVPSQLSQSANHPYAICSCLIRIQIFITFWQKIQSMCLIQILHDVQPICYGEPLR